MRRGFETSIALGLTLAALTPVMAFMPEGDSEPAALQHPAAKTGFSLRQAAALAGKSSTGIAALAADGSSVTALHGQLTPPTKGDAARIAADFARRAAPGAQFTVASSLASGGETHVRLIRTVEGLEVFGPDLAVHVGDNGSVAMVNGTLIEQTNIVNTLSITADQAIAAAIRALGAGEAAAAVKVLFPAAEGLRRAWKLELAAPAHLWVVLVDAQDGSILLASDQVRHINGMGSVYRRDPLHGEPSNEAIANLKGGGLLSGSWADVRNEDTERAKSDDHKFIYETTDTHFDEVNVYYHLDLVHAYFNHLGFTALDKPVIATVHVGDKFDNAYFDPRSGQLSFGDGNRLNDLSKDNTVAYHEYGHAVTNAVTGMMIMGEGGGLHEGYSDYFAGTITNDPVIGAYAGARLPSGNIRNMDNELHYPEDSGSEPHKAGRVWGGACWDVREALGSDVADKIVHQSRYYLPRFRPMFSDAYQGILKADQKLFNGSHAAKITEIFTKRGIAKAAEQLSVRELSRKVVFQDLQANPAAR